MVPPLLSASGLPAAQLVRTGSTGAIFGIARGTLQFFGKLCAIGPFEREAWQRRQLGELPFVPHRSEQSWRC